MNPMMMGMMNPMMMGGMGGMGMGMGGGMGGFSAGVFSGGNDKNRLSWLLDVGCHHSFWSVTVPSH